MEGATSLTSEMLNYPIELTTWRIESKNKPIVAVVDTYGSISFEGDPALEKLVNYIVMSEQPATGGSFKLVDEDGNEFPKSFDYPVAHVGDKIYIKADLDKNYEIVAAYNGIGEGKTELSKDGDQYYFKVPSGGGVNISIEVAKKAYDVTFVDEDGTTLKKYTVKLGEKPTYDGIEPSKKDDELYTYKFSGWSPEIVAVTEDTTYRATYTRSDHLYDKEVVDENYLKSEADCTHKAVYYKSCGECGEKGTETFEYGEPLDHDYKEIAGTAVAPTCTKAGKEADQKCSRCDAVITGKEIAATGHTFDQEVVDAKYLKSAADCITAAVYYKSCKCGEKSTDEKDIFTSGEPAGHKWKAATGYAPKTCEVCGLEEGQKVTYDPIKGQVFVWTKGSKEPFVLTIKRSQDDVNCFLHYLNTLLDGAEIKVEARSGSTIITIPAETLEKLSVGEHKITVVFDDWKADFALSIATAPADTTPVTGDTMPVVPIAVVMVVAFGAAGIAMRRKARMNRM
ncbi:MAG: hypothetical protein IKI01_07065 [Lachnospiraceae bacterium]|nr:hypothetical protein [Lachnospiraceae bacterium]